MTLSRLLAALAEHCRRRAGLVVLAGVVLASLSAWVAAHRLGVSTDTDKLFASELPWRQRDVAFNRDFPQYQDLLVAVVDGATPEEADQTAAALAAALTKDTTHFRSVRRPDASPYLEAHGLLFLEKDTLQDVLDRTIDAQPFLGQLVADPSARGLFAALTLVAIGAEQGQANLAPFGPSLQAFHASLSAAAAGRSTPLSWQRLLGGKVAEQGGPYRFVLAQPHLDYGQLEPGSAATNALRAAASQLEFVQAGRAHVRVTGSVALADEEFATVAHGAVAGTIGSAVLVTLWLLLAVRSWRLIVPIVFTLWLGLMLTTGFAALAVGTLNLISIAFAILFVGIAVDFGIQFSVRYREMRLQHGGTVEAMAATAGMVGPQILVAATAAAAGFLAFVPTDFRGVAELGLIAGMGMLIAFACTMTFLPAALTLCRPHAETHEVGFAIGDVVEQRLHRLRVPVLVGFAAVAVLGAVLLPFLTFDSDPLHTKDPSTEAMRTLADLMDSPLTNPYNADVMVPTLEAAEALAPRLAKLPLANQVLTLSSFVPEDQPDKLALVADAANILEATLAERAPAAPVTPADLRMAAATALKQIDHALPKLAPGDPLIDIGDDLRQLVEAPDATLMAANTALTRFLPLQLNRLRVALQAAPVTVADIPPEIARDWRLPDGRVRLQVLAKPQARGSAGLEAFVAEVRTVAPDAGGTAVTIVETAQTIIGAFRKAAIGAILAIAVILALVLRRVIDVGLVMTPLLMSGLLTVVIVVALHMPLNFANIIALPLLLGVGVSFNIYFVMNWRAGHSRFLGTATARAILFSALTTSTAFGSLALSRHPGTASMGELLLLSLGSTLVVTLFLMPTLLRALMRPG
ncbi:MMPL family transporter [Limobrevibacterium gyesilva]|uniref:MMPL family transporter n=1 Tax=Limobrevibacterium gyesilva TaxID=2991712 RepID=A0AA41YLJ9_9PROT|nr:MMPL family transporter [Limobrevibacterium gyesilva]MCW3474487.1 MMPL family transporter [Limobrevibacterium gyesilva]